MAINSIWNNNSPMDYLSFLSTDSDNNTEDNEWLTHFQQLVQKKLSEMNEDEDSAATVNPAEEIAKWKENIYNKMKNGETNRRELSNRWSVFQHEGMGQAVRLL